MLFLLSFLFLNIFYLINGEIEENSAWNRKNDGRGLVAFGIHAIPNKWRWMAALLYKDAGSFYHHCGGSLITDQHILTAAHCLVKRGRLIKPETIIVRLGQYDLRLEGQDFKVDQIKLHEKYNNKNYQNDIAIIKLSKRVEINDEIGPISLPRNLFLRQFRRENGTQVGYIAGWGKVSADGEFSDDLKEAKVNIVPQRQCQRLYRKYANITEMYICAGSPSSEHPSDACPGDSGGPLAQFDDKNAEYCLTGIVSFGRKCATPGVPGVYTKVEYYLDWIQENTIKRLSDFIDSGESFDQEDRPEAII